MVAVAVAVVASSNNVPWLKNNLQGKRRDKTGNWPKEDDSFKNFWIQRQVASKHSKLISHYFLTFTFHRSIFLICSILLVISFVESTLFSTRKKKPQNKKRSNQLSVSDADFMIGQSNHEAQASKQN